jgi:hypothetical protein
MFGMYCVAAFTMDLAMLREWTQALGFNRPTPARPPVTPARPSRPEPMATDAIRPQAVTPNRRAPTLQAKPPADHARALLTWLQGPGGRSGTIRATELADMHSDLCSELDWELAGWVAVGRELRRLIGTPKEYARIEGCRVCVYRIPPLAHSVPSAFAIAA